MPSSSTDPPKDCSQKSVTSIIESGKFIATTPLLLIQALMKDALEDRVAEIVVVTRDGCGGVHIAWDESVDTACLAELAMALRLESERTFALVQAEIEHEVDDAPSGD